MKSVKHSVDKDKPASKAALLVHGGCFTDGDETDHGKQADAIAAACGIDVFTIDFNTTSYEKSIEGISTVFNKVYDEYQGQVGLIGCSSGGFLALNVLSLEAMKAPTYVTLICPVFNPFAGEEPASAQGSDLVESTPGKQMTLFEAKGHPKPFYQVSAPVSIIAAQDDKRVPFMSVMSDIKHFKHMTPSLNFVPGGHEVCFMPNDNVVKLLNTHIEKATQHTEEAPSMTPATAAAAV